MNTHHITVRYPAMLLVISFHITQHPLHYLKIFYYIAKHSFVQGILTLLMISQHITDYPSKLLNTIHIFLQMSLHITKHGGDGWVVLSLDLCLKDPGFKTTFRPVIKCEERISHLSVIPGKKAKGITRCGHIERKDQGRTARLVYLFSGPFVLST